jgi:hypothetical protein
MTTLRLATDADDAVLRALLRTNGMPGWVEMAMVREPSFFAGRMFEEGEWAVIAEENGRSVGMYTVAARMLFVDGHPEQIRYLGGLRVATTDRHRIRHLRAGFASVRTLVPQNSAVAWWFTVIGSENVPARRLLEAGVPGLPKYEFLGDYVTLALPTARSRRRALWRPASERDLDGLVAFYNVQAPRFALTPVLDRTLVRGVGIESFYVIERAGRLQGVAALWNQRSFKQIVAVRYREPIGRLLPMYNFYARLFRRVPLPPTGEALNHTFVAFLALSDELQEDAGQVVGDLLSYCRTPIASLGLHARNPLNDCLRAFRPVRYPARVYGVTFEDAVPAVNRPVQPEVSLL